MRYFIIIFSLLSISSFPQNKINNGDFEGGNYINEIEWKAFIDGINNWESRTKYFVKNGVEYVWHSPDWYSNSQTTQRYVYFDYNLNQSMTVFAISGLRYIGMSNYELIQQPINLEANTQYVLKFSVFIDKSKYDNNSEINVYLAKNEVKYRKEKGKEKYICSDKFKKHKTGWGQGYLDIGFFNLDYYPKNEWASITKKFTISSSVNINDFDWFVVEGINSTSTSNCQQTYFLIDNMTLIKGCDNGCSSTDGQINVYTNGLTNENQMLKIYGLENIKKIKYRILSLLGQSVTNWFEYIKPPNIIAWDGRNTYGAELANAKYYIEMLLTNDCGTITKRLPFIKQGTYSYYTNNDSAFTITQSVSKPPEQCCLYDIHISNQTLIEDKTLNYPLIYRAGHNIYVENDVYIPENNKIELIAGNEVILEDFICDGDLTISTEECTKNNKIGNNYLTIFDTTNTLLSTVYTDSVEYEEIEQSEKNNIFDNKITVYPNPFKNILTINSSYNENNFTIEIYNILGTKVLTEQCYNNKIIINTSDFKSGAYFIKLIDKQHQSFSNYKLIKNE